MAEGIVRRHPTRGPGYAELRLPGAAAAVRDPRLRIYWEASAHPCLGPHGFQAAEAILHPEEAHAEGADLVLTLGPGICEHLETDTYDLVLIGLGNRRFVLPWVEIPRRPRQGRGTLLVGAREDGTRAVAMPDDDPEATVVAPPRTPAPPPTSSPEPPPPVDPPPIDPAAPTRRRNWPLALLLLPLLAAGGYWWWQHGQPVPPPEPPPGPVVPPLQVTVPSLPHPPAPEIPFACLDEARRPVAQQTAREIVARPECPVSAYVAIAAALQQAGRHDDALLLLERAAERGDAPAMGRLARLYDPNGFQPGQPFSAPDARQAALWYRNAVRAGDAGSEAPRAALHATLEQAAGQGDTLARLTLEDYWP